MTYYEYYTNKSDEFTRYALNTPDTYLKAFYSRAARGYIMRRDELTLTEALQEYEPY